MAFFGLITTKTEKKILHLQELQIAHDQYLKQEKLEFEQQKEIARQQTERDRAILNIIITTTVCITLIICATAIIKNLKNVK